jgi:hypothetical protein
MHWRKWHKIEETIFKGETSDVSGHCFFCGEAVSGMSYCFGCKEFVCKNCDHRNPNATGRHEVSEHQ